MRTTLIIGGLLLTLAAPASAEPWDFVLINKTDKAIKLVEVSETGKADWKKEILDEEEGRVKSDVKPGQDYTVRFEKSPKACAFDVRMTFADDTQTVWTNFDVCENPIGNFSLKGGVPVAKGV